MRSLLCQLFVLEFAVLLNFSGGVGLSFCVRRLGPFSKGVLRPKVIIFGVLRPAIFWCPRPRSDFYGVLRLTVLWRLACGVKFRRLASWFH